MGNIKGSDLLNGHIMQVTPQVAKDLLEKRTKNRPLSMSWAGYLARAIENGEWVIAQPILRDGEKRVMDGAHRLTGVILANRPVEFLFIDGFDYNVVFAKVDGGKQRSLKDALSMIEAPLPTILAPVIRMACRDSVGNIPTVCGRIKWTTREFLDFYDKHPRLKDCLRAPGVVNELLPRSLCCFCSFKFAQKDKALAKTFFVDLTLYQEDVADDPLYLLRARLKLNQDAKAKLSNTEILALIIKTWNAVRVGADIKTLKWSKTENKFPEVQ